MSSYYVIIIIVITIWYMDLEFKKKKFVSCIKLLMSLLLLQGFRNYAFFPANYALYFG